ncbi:MAG: antitoxin VapB family protein [Thermoproteota archaeon]
MGYKTISLSDEAYEKLASLKREGESFTDVILRLCSKSPKKPLASFAGSWMMSEGEEKKIFREVSELWSKYEESLLGH